MIRTLCRIDPIIVLALATAAATPWTSAAASIVNTTTYTLNISDLKGYPEPYPTVAVDLYDDGTAHVTFKVLNNINTSYRYFFLGESAAAVNVNGSFILSNITGGGPNVSPVLSDGGSQASLADFGSFNQTINNTDFTHRASSIEFTLTPTYGNSWADSSLVLTANELGHIVAGHIIVYNTDGLPAWFPGTTIFMTGFVADAISVPEPASATLLAIGLVGMAGYGWRRRRQGQAIKPE